MPLLSTRGAASARALGFASGGKSFIPEALALFARMSPAPSGPRKILINAAMVTMKASGALALMSCFWMPAAATAQAAALNWLSSSFTLTATNSPTFTADRGWQGDGATSYLQTGFSAPGSGSSSAAGVWINVDGADGGYALGGASGGSNSSQIRPNVSSVLTMFTGNVDTVGVTNGLGFSGWSRNSNIAVTLQKNASQSPGLTSGASFTSGIPIFLLADNNISPVGFTASRIAAAFMGPGLSTAQLTSVYNAVNTYLTAIGGA